MNRELKFRIWDTQNKEFSSWTNRDPFFDISTGKIFFWERVRREDGSYGGDVILEDHGERFVLQQYTGLKDQNGIEVYEGDIVLAQHDVHDIRHKDKKRVEQYIGIIEFHHSYFSIGNYKLFIMNDDSLIIKGNIFQNPELLAQ